MTAAAAVAAAETEIGEISPSAAAAAADHSIY